MWGRLGISVGHGSQPVFSNSKSYLKVCKFSSLLKESSTDTLPCLFVSQYHSKVARKPAKVHMPGEQIPSSKDKKITVITDDSMSVDRRTNPFAYGNSIFNEVMAEACKSSTRRHIVLEGERMVEEGFLAGLEIHKLFLQKGLKDTPQRLKPYMGVHNVNPVRVSQTSMKTWSSLTTPPGIVGVFVKPKPGEIREKAKAMGGIPVTVICDNLREPGNLGAILRSAAGAGCKRVLLSKGCADPWDVKTLRSGCGAHFYLPIIQNYPMHTLGTCMELESRDEGAEETIWLGEDDKKQVEEQNKSENNDIIPSDSSSSDSISGYGTPLSTEDEKPLASFALFLADSNDSKKNSRQSIPVIPYYDVDYKKFKDVYLVVGGETEGLSSEILRMTTNLQEVNPRLVNATVARLQIPLARDIESLNAGHAFAVLSFEMMRQYQHQPQ